MATPAPQQKVNFADILAGLSRPTPKGTWAIPSAGGTTVLPFAPQPSTGIESPFLYLAPPEPTSQVVTMPMPAPPVAAVAPVMPVMPSATGVSTSVSGVSNVNIPDVNIPPAPVMPAGMTLEQAIAVGQALAPNVNLQPLTHQDILGTEDTSSLIGLLPEHVKQLMDTRTQLRASKAAEDAAAVALAKQTQGLDVAQDIAKDIPRQKQASDLAQFGAKATERLTAQKAKTDRDIAQAKIKFDALTTLYSKPNTNVDRLNQEIAGIKLLYMQPGGEKYITAKQANIAGLVKTMSGPESLQFLQDFSTNISLLPPDIQAKFSGIITPDVEAMLKQNIASMKDVPSAAGGVERTLVPIGGK